MFSRLLLLGAVMALGAMAQDIPSCESGCVTSSLTASGCGSASDQCACDPTYQNAMLQCLARPVGQGGCTFAQIIAWQNRIQTQCFMSPPILPPCLTICPLRAQMVAGCSSDADRTCICGSTYSSAATQCIQTACEEQLADWQTSYQDACRGQSGSITPSATPSPSGSDVPGISSPHDTVISGTPTSTATSSSPSGTNSTGAAISKHALPTLGGGLYLVIPLATTISLLLGVVAIF